MVVVSSINAMAFSTEIGPEVKIVVEIAFYIFVMDSFTGQKGGLEVYNAHTYLLKISKRAPLR